MVAMPGIVLGVEGGEHALGSKRVGGAEEDCAGLVRAALAEVDFAEVDVDVGVGIGARGGTFQMRLSGGEVALFQGNGTEAGVAIVDRVVEGGDGGKSRRRGFPAALLPEGQAAGGVVAQLFGSETDELRELLGGARV